MASRLTDAVLRIPGQLAARWRGAPFGAPDAEGNTPLHRAARDGRLEDVLSLVSTPRVDLHGQNRYGQTAMHAAARSGHADAIRVMLKHQGDPIAEDGAGNTPLHLAAQGHHLGAMNALLADVRVKPDARNKMGNTPLHLGALADHVEVIEKLIAAGASTAVTTPDGSTAFHTAAALDHARALRALLSDPQAMPNALNLRGDAPVHVAVGKKHVAALTTLLQHPAVDPNARTGLGMTPLHVAVEGRDVATVAALLANARVDPAALSPVGESAVHVAARTAQPSVLEAFVRAGVALRQHLDAAPDAWGYQDVVAGRSRVTDAVMRVVLADLQAAETGSGAALGSFSADLPGRVQWGGLALSELADAQGSHLLHRAAERGLVGVLLAQMPAPVRGPYLNARNLHGETAAHIAARRGDADAITALSAQGADLDARDRTGETPLLTAARAGQQAVVAALVDVPGVTLTAVNQEGASAFHLAAVQGHSDVLMALGEKGGAAYVQAALNAMAGGQGTPLHAAAAANRVQALNHLVQAGASLDARNGQGRSPLHHAAGAGAAEAVQTLLEQHAADPLARDSAGNTAVHEAAELARADVLQAFVRQGVRMPRVPEDWPPGVDPAALSMHQQRVDRAAMAVAIHELERGTTQAEQDMAVKLRDPSSLAPFTREGPGSPRKLPDVGTAPGSVISAASLQSLLDARAPHLNDGVPPLRDPGTQRVLDRRACTALMKGPVDPQRLAMIEAVLNVYLAGGQVAERPARAHEAAMAAARPAYQALLGTRPGNPAPGPAHRSNSRTSHAPDL